MKGLTMKNKDIEKRFDKSEWKELKRLRNRVKSGKEEIRELYRATFNARRKS